MAGKQSVNRHTFIAIATARFGSHEDSSSLLCIMGEAVEVSGWLDDEGLDSP